MEFKDYALENDLGLVYLDKSFKDITTISTGGNIKYLYYPKDVESLKIAFKYISENNIKHCVIGNGSNILALDNYYDGVVISLKKMEQKIVYYDGSITVSASYPTIKLAYELAEKELGDLSFLGGIPGLLGGAIYNNSGAYKDSIGNHIISVSYITSSGEIKTISKNSCAFTYRKSIFHYIDGIIIEATIRVYKVDTKDTLERRARERKEAQPSCSKSMGSVFKNNPLIPSWVIIDSLGLRGFQIGGAVVSQKHCNFILNFDNATSNEILSIIDLITTRARLEFGIEMIKEISIIK